jgi:hypothetical protein
MAATLLYGGNLNNQFRIDYQELEHHARTAKVFERTHATEVEIQYTLVTQLGNCHTVIVPTHDRGSLELIRYGRQCYKTDLEAPIA